MNLKQYKKLAEKRRAEEPVYDVTLPSGLVWKMRKPPIQQWLLAGKLPTSLIEKLPSLKAAIESGEITEENAGELPLGDIFKSIEFTRDMLFYAAVSPKISLDPQGDDEIAPEDILPTDFKAMVAWCQNGGDEGKALNSFRGKRK